MTSNREAGESVDSDNRIRKLAVHRAFREIQEEGYPLISQPVEPTVLASPEKLEM